MMTTSEELFAQIIEIIEAETEVQNRLMHKTLATACREGLKGSKYGFGNLAAQVDRLCRDRAIADDDAAAINTMRRHSNSRAPILPDDLLYDCRALALFVSAVFREDIPGAVLAKIPPTGRQAARASSVDQKYIRCVVRSWDDELIRAAVISDDRGGELLTVDYANTPEHIDLTYLRKLLREGMQLNLLDCRTKGRRIIPEVVVVEPDYLLDTSAIAGCFEEYGHHPLLYTVKRLAERPSNKHTLLGNFAGAALDDIINNPTHYDISNTFRANFRDKALEFATCQDFSRHEFMQEASRQAKNIEHIAAELFSEFSRDKALLEPSFICEKLGLQGRVDLMTTDFKLLVEQKSGRNIFIERKRGNRYGSLHIEKHYVQLLLYFGILQYNFGLSSKRAAIRLLYSRYPLPEGLLDVMPLRKLLLEAVKFRNMTVATEYWIAHNGFEKIISRLTPETLNTERLDSDFYKRYLLPPLARTLAPFATMSNLERAYFSRMATFVMKEQLISKVGAREGISSCHADLWNMPLDEKIETGNIFTHLTIASKQAATRFSGFNIITLNLPEQQAQNFLPNFRRGDMIFLYSYEPKSEPDVRRSILFKGAIEEIMPEQIVVRLNDGQQNPQLISGECFAIEHAASDIGATTALRGLYTLITAPAERRRLLFGLRAPQAGPSPRLSKSYGDYHDIICRARSAKDYFLLIGPPGTGKTSQALQHIVREHLDGNILLMAYTNRAVDEICAMLSRAGLEYIRLGNPLSCDPQFAPHLLSELVQQQPSLQQITSLLDNTRIIVGTTSTIGSRDYLFRIKHFDLAIVDEAGQILEPNIIGLLSAHHNAQSRIGKFILVGDYKQLPAVVQQSSPEAQTNNPLLNDIHLFSCADSLFERLIRTERAAGREQFIGTLNRQGRMHPDIAHFPSQQFYAEEQLQPVPLAHQTEKQLYPDAPLSSPLDTLLATHRMIFIPSENCRRPNLSDKVNTHEARITATLLARLHSMLGPQFSPQHSVGVIVPYRNQIAMIRNEINKLNTPELLDITIDTVERFQGSQRDIIIYSFTVQRNYQLDFLTANTFTEHGRPIDRKLNVALTRARKQLIMTGNEPTLRQSEIFSKLIDDTRLHGGYLPAPPLPF